MKECNFEHLVGKTLIEITGMTPDSERVIFITDALEVYMLEHLQDCCETVRLLDVIGDHENLLGTPILKAEVRTNSEDSSGIEWIYYDESFTWTFYELATIKGSVTLRWLGQSNGYYSESVDFYKQG
jgi:hypothetical protein